MTVVFSSHAGDVQLTLGLLEWIKLLGTHRDHSALIVVDAALDWGDSSDVLNLANEIFRTATLITNDQPTQGWIPGSNSLFAAAAQHMESIGEPWLWIESDATPLRKGWLDAIATAYQHAGKPFMGSLVYHDLGNRPNPYFEGCGVYPADTWSRIKEKFILEESWTLWCAAEVVPYAVNSTLFQHFWGVKDLPPTFAPVKRPDSPINTFTLADVSPDAVLYHRCKDGSLMRLLHQKFFPESNGFVVVLPFCNKDGALMAKNVQWMQRLGGCHQYTALLAYDRSTMPRIVEMVTKAAQPCFGNVLHFTYGVPPRLEHPHSANFAFRAVASYIHTNIHRPFLWFESDMVPLKKGWLDTLQKSYAQCRKPFFGTVVPGAGHFNGTAVYPADTIRRCGSLRVDNDDAFDTKMRDETAGQVFDASALMCCAWSQFNGRLQPTGHGELPYFSCPADVRRIPPTAVTFHRDKTLSLIDQLSRMGVA